MEFQVGRNLILKALNIVKQAVPNRPNYPILGTIRVEAKEDGWLVFRGHNLTMDIVAEIKGYRIIKPGVLCVNSIVCEVISSFDEDKYEGDKLINPVIFSLKGDKLTISQGKRKHHPIFILAEEYPKDIPIGEFDILLEVNDFVETVRRLRVSISPTTDREILQAIHIDRDYMVSGNEYTISMRDNINVTNNPLSVPNSFLIGVLSNLTSLSPKDTLEVSFADKLIFRASIFSEELYMRWQIIINAIYEDYPEGVVKVVRDYLEKDPVFSIITKKEDLVKILQLCKIYKEREGSDSTTNVLMESKEGDVMFSMKTDFVEMNEPLVCETKGEEFRIIFNPIMLLEAIQQSKSEKLELKFFGEALPILFVDGCYIYLQAPMKK